MKTVFILILTMLLIGCTSFNRDALWNAPIKEYMYCSYFPHTFPIGSIYVHRYDDWTEKRLKYEYELEVVDIINDKYIVLDHGWSVLYYLVNMHDWPYGIRTRIRHKPIIVILLDKNIKLNIGDQFKVYGQYMYLGCINNTYELLNKYKDCKVFRQINNS